MAVGRISGPLLKSNLIRNGIDLAFETDLLYLDVNNQRIGVSKTAPQYELDVNGTTRTTDLIVDNRANIADIEIINNTISTQSPYLNIATLDTVVSLNKLRVDSLDIEGNLISSNQSNADIDFTPNGTGEVNVRSNMRVDGDIHATGNISADGSITLGDADTDNVVFNAEVASNIIPDQTNTYSLGSDPDSGGKQWNDVWVRNLNASTVNSTLIDIDGIDLTLTPGNTYYVSENGDDANTGDHPQDPYATVKYAVENAVAGDTVHIYPGVYTEEFPITVPVGVSVKGESIRSVTIRPTTETRYNDAFLLNGESTVVDVTISGFYSGGNFFEVTGAGSSPVWPEQQKITASDAATVDYFGYSVAIDGDTAIIGAYLDDDNGNASGSAYIYTRSGGTWTQQQKITASDGAIGDYFGRSVAISGDTAIVGALSDNDDGSDSGSAYVFTRSGGTWTQQQKITASDGAIGDLFGSSVAIDGDTAIVGAYRKNSPTDDEGAVYIFTRSGSTWTQQQKIEALDKQANDYFGYSVAISGDTAIVGAYLDDDNGSESGSAYIYTRSGGTWTQQQKITASDGASSDYFGLSLAIDGDTAIIGAYANDDDGSASGSAYIFTRSGGVWTEQEKITASDAASSDLFGRSVAISGDTAIVGAYANDDDGNASGSAYIYNRPGGTSSTTVNVGTTEQAHAYVSGGTITIDDLEYSITGADYNETTGVLEVYHTGGSSTVGNNVFLSDISFSCNGGIRTFPDNGYAFRFATDFEVTTRSPYIKNVSVITAGSSVAAATNTPDDPRGFNDADAGKGALVDGAYATTDSKEAAMLFHSVTFITPGVDGLTATNGARIEWLNSFTYFANRSLFAFESNEGLYSEGKTRIRLGGITGTFAQGDEITFTSTDGSTTFDVTVDTIEGDYILIDGKETNFIGFDTTPQNIQATVGSGATATSIENLDYRDFGAEIRMIGSASVYGNFGLVGDGAGVIVYAIGHNLAYIGNGKEVSNDPSTVIQVNEVVELNDAQIRFNSVDHKGDFRVGELFYVNQEDGTVDFAVTDFTINTTDGVTFNTSGQTTFIDGTKIETGDWRISGNTLETLTQDADIAAASGNINLNSNVNVTGNLDVTGNVTIGGNITIGDEATDTIQIVAGIDSDILPSTDSVYSLGSETKQWANLYINEVNIDEITIRDNFITTNTSNADLELRANGTGEVVVPSNNVQINNDLTVDGTTTLQDVTINNQFQITGDISQTGNYNITGDLEVQQNLTVGAAAQFEEILVDDNFITTTTSNTDLELRAAGTGNILVPNNNVTISNDATINGILNTVDIVSTGSITADSFTNNNILIDNNVIETTQSNSDLELRAAGTGVINIPENNVSITNNLDVDGVTNLDNTNINGTITHVGDTTQTGNYTITGQFSNGDIQIDSNTIETTASNSDLELRANGGSTINIPTNNVTFSQALTVSGATDLQDTTITGTVTHVGDYNQTGNFTIGGEITNGNILIEDNFISTTVSNADLELRAAGTGEVLIPDNDVRITNNLFVNGDATLGDTTLTGNVNITGDVTQSGDYSITSDVSVGGDLTVTRSAQFEEILIDDNFITTTTSNADLELRANGTGEVLIPNNNVRIINDLDVVGTFTVDNIVSSGTITANRFSTGDILIDDNFITTTLSNSDLELRANGTGEVVVPSNDVTIEQDLTVNGTTTLANTSITGNVTVVGDYSQTGNLDVSGSVTATQDLTVTGAAQFENIRIDDNVIETTASSSDLILRASGNGNILITDNNVEITNNLTVSGTITVSDISATGTISANNFSTGDILIDDNFITTTTSNSDLELRTSGTGSIVIDDLSINDSTISSSTDITLSPGSENVIIDSTGSLKLPTGNTSERPTGVAGQIRYNSELSRFEGFNGSNWIVLHGVEDLDGDTKVTAELTEGANDDTIRFDIAGTTVADINSDRLNAEKVIVDDIQIDGNVISTITADTDLEFTANGTGSVVIDNFTIKDNVITNTVSDSVTNFANTNNGYVKFDGTYGLVIPAGTTSERPPSANSETGMTRFNTTDERMEVYDGSTWIGVAGAGSGISRSDAENLAFEIVLSLG